MQNIAQNNNEQSCGRGVLVKVMDEGVSNKPTLQLQSTRNQNSCWDVTTDVSRAWFSPDLSDIQET